MFRFMGIAFAILALTWPGSIQGQEKNLAGTYKITLNGQPASFLAGGQFPVPVVTGTQGGGGLQGVQFVPFGVQLQFTPVQLSLLFAWFGLFGFVGNVLMSRNIDRLGASRSVMLGICSMALSSPECGS